MRTQLKSRKLRIESLEERTLLAVTAGAEETAAAFIAPTAATTWNVNTLDDPASWDAADIILSLREAVFYAGAGGTVTFDASLAGQTITLNGTQIEIYSDIVIDASSVGGMTIDADKKSWVFYIDDMFGPSVELVGLTITGGSDETGGAIYNTGSLRLIRCAVTGNRAAGSGGRDP